MSLVLRAEQGNKNAYKSLIAAEYCGVKVDHVFQMGVSDKTHLFVENSVFVINHHFGMVPVLETPDGPIFESNGMARYVAKLNGDNNTLCGFSVYELVQIEEWMTYATTEIDEALTRWVYIRTGVYPYNARAERVLIDFMKKSLCTLNTHLAKKANYLVGNCITLADIVMACDLFPGFTHVLTKSFTSEFPHVERYFWNIVGQPNFKKVLGEVKQPESLPKIQPVALYVRRELFEALNKKRTNQTEGGLNYQLIKVKKAKAVHNQMMKVEKELNQMTEEQRERINQMVLNDDVASCDGSKIIEK
ncbi:hypothetical protein LUZ60_008455 [Juncus effusus]|nr:hypothetical protein LUZ60_008455 [Juncus effusus]